MEREWKNSGLMNHTYEQMHMSIATRDNNWVSEDLPGPAHIAIWGLNLLSFPISRESKLFGSLMRGPKLNDTLLFGSVKFYPTECKS